jgi:uncharacterized SAM-binding protein YcdF (DUF218 family)
LAAAQTSSRSGIWKIPVMLACVYVAGFVLFVCTLPRAAFEPVRADGIVALTGGDERINAAEALLEKGDAKRLLITGVYSTITKSDLKKLVHGGRRFDCCTDLGFKAMSTHGNATEAAQWAHAHGYKSLVIVTANYHMPRSLREFSTEMPDIRLLPYPVEQDDVDIDQWWRDPHTFRALHLEYVKYLGSLFFTTLASQESAMHSDRKSHTVRDASRDS